MSQGRARGLGDNSSPFGDLLSAIPSGGDLKSDIRELENMRADANNTNVQELSPEQLHAKLWAVLTIRDRSMSRFYPSVFAWK
jgi:hypothetical protein